MGVLLHFATLRSQFRGQFFLFLPKQRLKRDTRQAFFSPGKSSDSKERKANEAALGEDLAQDSRRFGGLKRAIPLPR